MNYVRLQEEIAHMRIDPPPDWSQALRNAFTRGVEEAAAHAAQIVKIAHESQPDRRYGE